MPNPGCRLVRRSGKEAPLRSSQQPGIATLLALIAGTAILGPGQARGAVVTVVNNDGAGEGFNDPTVASPVGGNTGTTIGAQRLLVFQTAAAAWGARLTSGVAIVVTAQFNPLSCTASSAVLGSAGPTTAHSDFSGAPFASTFYVQALANRLSGTDLSVGNPDISAQFNSQIGTTGCLQTSGWYYGLDHQAPANRIDLFAVVEHEIGHGLGFVSLVDLSTGAKFGGRDDAYMRNLEDHTLGLTWPNMSNAQRLASMTDTGDLHWIGAAATTRIGLFSSGVASGHLRMFAPNPVQGGSSVSHWDTALLPNELMEPSYVAGAAIVVTDELMTDIGWGPVNMGEGGLLYPLTPCRLVDTRLANGPLGGPALSANETRTFDATPASPTCGIPSTAKGLSVNYTIESAQLPGELRAFAGNGTWTGTSVMSFRTGLTRANNGHLMLATDGTGTFQVTNASAGTISFILDVNGYYE